MHVLMSRPLAGWDGLLLPASAGLGLGLGPLGGGDLSGGGLFARGLLGLGLGWLGPRRLGRKELLGAFLGRGLPPLELLASPRGLRLILSLRPILSLRLNIRVNVPQVDPATAAGPKPFP